MLELDLEVEAAGLGAVVLEPEAPDALAGLLLAVTVVPGALLVAPAAALAVVVLLLPEAAGAGAGAGAVLLAKIMN